MRLAGRRFWIGIPDRRDAESDQVLGANSMISIPLPQPASINTYFFFILFLDPVPVNADCYAERE